MAVSKRQRRRIVVEGKPYVWWIAPDEDAADALTLTVASERRGLFVRYALAQAEHRRHVSVCGPRFRAVAGCGGSTRRFRCPAFGRVGEVRPADVAQLIRWATDAGEPPTEVDGEGRPVV